MNQWLSDGTVALRVNGFRLDPTGPSSSPVAYYRVQFAIKNITRTPLEMDSVSVEFLTADLAETVRARSGDAAAREIKPFRNEINWSRNLDNPRASRAARVIGPLDIEALETSGHFYFGESDPSVAIALYRGGAIVGGPFRVALGRRLPK